MGVVPLQGTVCEGVRRTVSSKSWTETSARSTDESSSYFGVYCSGCRVHGLRFRGQGVESGFRVLASGSRV
jgi:hypothetical protein